jgi:hypothetical protein
MAASEAFAGINKKRSAEKAKKAGTGKKSGGKKRGPKGDKGKFKAPR